MLMGIARLGFLVVSIVAVGLVVYVSCGGGSKSTGTTTTGGEITEDKEIPDGLDIQLSEADDHDPNQAANKLVNATALSDSAAKSLLSRLPDIAQAEQSDFAFRKGSPPAPRPGTTITDKFPAKGSGAPPATQTNQGPLKVVRFAPEGELGLAPHVSLTFSDPMVAISSHDDVQAKAVPVKLSPTPEGRWRWLGTRTLIFDPVVRMPMATKFSLEVPQGTKSANGNALAEAHRWSFTTPPPSVVAQNLQGRSRALTPLLFAGFDQAINADDVLSHMRMEVSGDRVAVRKLNADELEDEDVRLLIEASDKRGPNRYLAFTVKNPLPKAADVYVGFPEGLPSAEGPLRTTSEQSFTFRTFDPLVVEDQNCDSHECYPGNALSVHFNNVLDADAFDPASIRVSPEIKNMRAVVSHSYLTVTGLTRAETTYTLSIPSTLKDEFGQTFGKEASLEFRFGESHPRYFAPSGVVVADPGEKKPKFRVHTFGHERLHVEAYRMTPAQWTAFEKFQQDPIDWERRRKERPSFVRTPFKAFNARPGKQIFRRTINVNEHAKGELAETAIELEEVLGGRYGHAFLLIVGEPRDADPQNVPPYTVAWVQSTTIGLDAAIDDKELVVWANDLSNGKPRGGVTVDAFRDGTKFSTVTTADNGLASIEGSYSGNRHHIVARSSDQTAIVPGTHFLSRQGDSLAWHVFDDRRMYKPGEEVNVKGWVRQIQWNEGGDVAASPKRNFGYVVYGTRGNELHKGRVTLNAFGGFDMKFKLPDNANLGHAEIAFKQDSIPTQRYQAEFRHTFQIQEFRRPEYEVSVEKAEGPFVVGTATEVTASASYFAGGGLPQADVQWSVSQSPAHYAPPGWDGFTFGKWVPWWISPYGRGGWWWPGPPKPAVPALSFSSTTDGAGKHRLQMRFKSVKPAEPTTVRAQATVQDVNRQAWAAETSLLVHPSSVYVGLKVDKPYAAKDEPVHVDAVLANIDGDAVADTTIAMTFARIETQWENGEYVEVEREAKTCQVSSKAGKRDAAAVRCSFEPNEGGRHRIRALVRDKQGRLNQSELTVWVSGVGQPKSKQLEEEQVDLVPDKKSYKPGETAEVFIQSPFAKAEGLVTFERSGILQTQRITIAEGSTVIKVPIKDVHTPNLFVRVDLVGEAARLGADGKPLAGAGTRPAFATGSIGLDVPPQHRELKVEVSPSAKRVAPATVAKVNVKVTGPDGKPKPNAEVAIVVVDEAILALTGAEFANPLDAFYPQRPSGVHTQRIRRFVHLTDPESLEQQNQPAQTTAGRYGGAPRDKMDMVEESSLGAPMAEAEAAPAPAEPGRAMAKRSRAANAAMDDAADGAASQPKVHVRTDFRALVAFSPSERTNGAGVATLSVKLPDSLTRYRVVALAVEGDKLYGKGESNITARKPLMVRPSAPRFLNFGDKFELPVVVQNQTDQAMTVSLASRASNITFTQGQGRRFNVPANDRVEVRLPATTQMAGKANFQVVATAGNNNDAAFFELPVWTPATTEAFAEYGSITEGAIAQPIAAPSKVVPQFGGLEITTTSTQLHTLTDAVLYLVSYPYECAEQVSSRMLGVAALEKVLGAFEAEGLPEPDEIRKTVRADIEKLQGLQNYDGGFSFWRRGLRSWPWVTVHVAHALQRAKEAGYEVPSGVLNNAHNYMRNIDNHMRALHYGPEVRRTIESYALYVRARGGDVDASRAATLVGAMEDGELEARAWALYVLGKAKSHADLRKKILRHFANRATETASTAQFTTSFGEGAYTILHSARRTDAVILEALLEETPNDQLAIKLVRGLLAHKTKGRWQNTQENVFVLLSLKKYFEVFEKITPNFVARAWLGDQMAAEHAFRGRTTERHHVDIPMQHVLKSPVQNLVVSKDGPGRLYYRLGMRYAPQSLWLAARDEGFAVERTYEAVDDESDVSRQSDGTWVVKAGARVRVRLTMVAESRRHHVALVDPLPAGFEAMNPELAVTGDVPTDPNASDRGPGGPYWWWWRPWYEHQNMRDERTEAFASLLYPGVHEYSYVARATTPGTFIVPPTRAEEMYSPETFGRASSEKVIVR